MHRDAIAFGLEKMPGQENTRGNPDSAMEWSPSPGAFPRKIQFGPRIRLPERFVHGLAVEPQLRDREHPVGIDPGIRTADRILNFASPGIGKMRNLVQAQVGVTRNVAQTEGGNQVEVT